jgi:hypothetical protein
MARELSMLRARVRKLESGQVVAADLVGRYVIHSLGIEMGANPYIATEADGVIMTLRADGTGAWTVTGDAAEQGRCELTFSPTPSVSCNPGADEGPATFAWRFENGNFVFIDEDGEHAIPVGAGGRMMVVSQVSEFLPVHSWSNMIIAMRLPN